MIFFEKSDSIHPDYSQGKGRNLRADCQVGRETAGLRGVDWILHSSSKSQSLFWQRVVNSKEKISFPEKSAAFVKQKNFFKK
jgi:methylated-DNA-protein-cysteine methyltransferase-like protein